MKLLLRIMQTNSSLQNSSGLNIIKQKIRTEKNVRSLFESTSFVIPNRNLTHRSITTEVAKDSSTQTSKTVVSLDAGCHSPSRMSPDSLSPKTDPDIFLSRDNPVHIDDGLSYARKSCVLRYLHNPRNDEQDIKTNLADNSLTKAFLEKTRRKTSQVFSPRVTRSNFLQQTSPLRKIIPNVQESHFKSHSYAVFSESFSECAAEYPGTRFKVKHVSEKGPASDIVKPVKYFCEKELALNLSSSRPSPKNTRNYSFMSPTFSSEQKNKMREIKNVTRLISATRRGRSASPKANVQRSPSMQKKVPYIDKSSSSIFHGMGDSVMGVNLRSPKLQLSTSTIFESTSDFNPEHELVQAISKMRDPDWNLTLRGLAEIVEISRSVDTDIVYPHMTIINQRIIDMLRSSRSHVCRTTCKAVGHLFEYIKDTRRPEFDEMVDTLLCRTADSNKFIRHDANLALDCMVTHIPLVHAIRALCAKGPDHKNTLVRIATARLVVCAVVIAGPTHILNPNNSDYTRRRIILNMVKFLNDKHLETRKYGERLYKLFVNDNRMFDIYLRRYLEKETYQKLKACFKNQHRNGMR